jgi:hypothetical protein
VIKDFLVSIAGQSLIVTGFVFVTMLVIEYLNVLTRGAFESRVNRYRQGQPLFTALLAVFPGCIGNYAVVSFYSHGVITFGALVAGMIATAGDEAFFMLALFPRQALLLFAVLVAVGTVSGIVIDLTFRGRRTAQDRHQHLADYVPVHEHEDKCFCFSYREILHNWRHCSAHRGWLTIFLGLFLAAVVTGAITHQHIGIEHGQPHSHRVEAGQPTLASPPAPAADAHHSDWGFEAIALLLAAFIGLLIVATVPEHFLEEHLWNHLAKKHIGRIFLWTLGALLATHMVIRFLDIDQWVQGSRLTVLLVACLVGIIPESGPHLIFTMLFAEGRLPFSILLANSIVQDGHGMLPMLAHSRRGFVAVKAVKIVIALGVGLLGYLMGW